MKEYVTRKIKSKRKCKFTYSYTDMRGKKASKRSVKLAVKDIYVPPAYDNVRINLNKKEKVLAIGSDEKGRSQYVYNAKFTEKQSKTKYKKMIDFGESYNKIMNQVKRDLYAEGDTKDKQIAMALILVVDCGIRIGSEKYRDENKSFGATTLESRHIKVSGSTVSVDFIGKKGIQNTGKSRSKRLSRNLRIKKRSTRANEPVFSYSRGSKWHTLKSTDVNKYLKKFGNFSSKNFRTWVANLSFITELLKRHVPNKCETDKQKKDIITESVKVCADKLNNTPSVCKSNYIDPYIIKFYLEDTKRFIEAFRGSKTKDEISERYIKLLKH